MAPVEKDHSRGLNGALAAEIRAEMGVQEVSGHQLAELSGIDRLTLRRYLKTERGWTTANVEAVSQALGLDPGELMRRAVERRDRQPEVYGRLTLQQALDIVEDRAEVSDVVRQLDEQLENRRGSKPPVTKAARSSRKKDS